MSADHPELARRERGCCGLPGSGSPSKISGSCCSGTALPRREFVALSAVLGVGTLGLGGIMAGPFEPVDTADHFVPPDKKLNPEWVNSLFQRGERTFYRGTDLKNIAMPIGGICTGQLYLTGDGRLDYWDIFNAYKFSGYGATNYQARPQPAAQVRQGFAVRVRSSRGTVIRTLDQAGFGDVTFCGEYPIAEVHYQDPNVPVRVKLAAFSPFIPLNEEDSGIPVTILEYTVTNPTEEDLDVTLAGWLENAVMCHRGIFFDLLRVNSPKCGENWSMIDGACRPGPESPVRPPIVLADFEGDSYGNWVAEGEAVGTAPARGTLPRQQPVTGFLGGGLVNTYQGGDDTVGRLLSPAFTINRRFINFLIGGGAHPGETCVNLLVDGQIVRTATGKNTERLEWHTWDVREFEGKEAQIEILDRRKGPWGHVNVDQIELRDRPRSEPTGPAETQRDFGTMGLAILEREVLAATQVGVDPVATVFSEGVLRSWEQVQPAEESLDCPLVGALAKQFSLRSQQSASVRFLVAWSFPNLHERGERRGNYYANRFPSASAVVEYVAANFERLSRETRLWHETWYDSTLPHWLLDRLFSTVSTLATTTCQWWANGRFWAYEGVGCCHGTCSHVWNYAHAMGRLFPRLERSVRELQDFNPPAGFVEETGMIRFRGEGWNMWAGDGQAGTILKAYREHLVSTDSQFLRRSWPFIKKALEFLINEDKDENGILEGSQHNTYDINFEGPNTMVGSLYLAALRAGEELAKEMGDDAFAQRCRTLFERGKEYTAKELFNGEYFIQKVDLTKHPKHQYADGCLSDQLFGQGWAHQVGLGYIYPPEMVRSALKAIWVYNWTPDVGPQNQAHPPQRWFARPGQGGLFVCTWPKSKHLGPESVLYRDEVWTGCEYQVAGHMVWEGMLTEALVICRAVHDRYHPSSHNPWNEVECGDHYARALASHGVFLALCGFEYHGPRQHIGFTPRFNPENFRAAFTAAEGWGSYTQSCKPDSQVCSLIMKWGRLPIRTLAFELPEGKAAAKVTLKMGEKLIESQFAQTDRRLEIRLAEPAVIGVGDNLEVAISFA